VTRMLEGRGAVVTGGGRGIGAATARALAAAGAKVVVAARTREQVEAVARAIVAAGGVAFAEPCDVTDEAQVRALGAAARRHLGAVDLLINNAGGAASAKLERLTLEEWNRTIAANVTSTFLCAREFAPDMVRRGFGRVVNVASVAGLEGGKFISHYSAAKHAVIGFTRALAVELAGTGVNVNAVCPGYVDTPMTERTIANVMERTGLDHERALAAVLQAAGQERLVTAEEVAEHVVALCSPEAAASGMAVLVREDVS
jgi:NAD(P)-dependent dehydrogenase (short-subunit alcohol dehydrogenase family)